MYSFMSDGVHVENKQRPKKIHPNDEGKQKMHIYTYASAFIHSGMCVHIYYMIRKRNEGNNNLIAEHDAHGICIFFILCRCTFLAHAFSSSRLSCWLLTRAARRFNSKSEHTV